MEKDCKLDKRWMLWFLASGLEYRVVLNSTGKRVK